VGTAPGRFATAVGRADGLRDQHAAFIRRPDADADADADTDFGTRPVRPAPPKDSPFCTLEE
jgi:hypothetical protein